MKKKFVRVMLFGALALATGASFVGCKAYDDDIDAVNARVDGIEKTPPPCLLKYVSIRHIGKPNITNAETILFTYLRPNKPKPTSLDGFKNKAPEIMIKTGTPNCMVYL